MFSPTSIFFRRVSSVILLLPAIASASTLNVGPGESFTSIQAAVDAASPGDTIIVAPGVYPENLVIGKSPLVLSGCRAAVDARGRVAGTPDPANETIVSPAGGKALDFTAVTDPVTVSGFCFSSPANGASGVVSADASTVPGLVFTNNRVAVASGANGSALWLNRSAPNATISGNVFIAAESSPQAVFLDGPDQFRGLHFINNDVLRDGALGNTGFFVDGNRNLEPSALRAPLIRGNRFQGHALGFNGGSRSLVGVEISSNSFIGNTGGMAAGPKDCLIKDNLWADNTSYGLRFTSFGNTTDATRGASGNTVTGNDFHDNGSVVSAAGYGDIRIDDQADGNQDSNVFHLNRLGSAVALFNNEPSLSIHAARNFWGAADGPGGLAPGSGGGILGVGNVIYQPYCTDAGFNAIAFGNLPLDGELTLLPGQSIMGSGLTLAPAAALHLGAGSEVNVGSLNLQSGASLAAGQGTVRVGKLQMAPDAVLDVVGGSLSLDPLGSGESHTIAGSFTFFNSLGSLNINADTTFSGGTLGIISDIHVAPDVTLTVLGSLVLDGCTLDGTAPYQLAVSPGAAFTMARCEVSQCALALAGNEVSLYDNRFDSSTLTVSGAVNGANIYHNIITAGPAALVVDPAAVVTTDVEGWGNVTAEATVRNQLELAFRAPLAANRTLDAGGNLFVQPGDAVDVGLDLSMLDQHAQAVEALLGYSTDHLIHDSLGPSTDWSNSLYDFNDDSAVIGRLNTTIGLGFNFPDPDGTTADGTVADIHLQTKPLEGQTRFFFRMKSPADEALIDTRITGSAAGVQSLTAHPFTLNTAVLTIDGTAPVFAAGATAVQIRDSVPVDVLLSGNLTGQGLVTVTFDAADPLAGVDDADVQLLLTGVSGTIPGVLTGTSLIDIAGTVHTRYVFEVPVTAATPNGNYGVDATVMDRSGNSSSLAIGTLEIQKNRITAEVQPQGLDSAALTRDVVFTATDSSGAVLASWTLAVGFSGGTGSAVLEFVPDDTARLSAKMAWNRRIRLPAVLDPEGQASASFTGASQLPGGDLNGDNIVNLGDYNILRAVFPGINPAADITGDGIANVGDYNVQRANWLSSGDPL